MMVRQRPRTTQSQSKVEEFEIEEDTCGAIPAPPRQEWAIQQEAIII